MREAIKLFSLLFLVLPSFTFAQNTGYIENFNDNTLTNWTVPDEHLRTYTLTEQDSVLYIDYHRTSESWEWDHFRFAPPDVIDASGHPFISVRAKSTFQATLAFKPVYGNDTSEWTEVVLQPDDLWHTYTFELLATDAAPMTTIYMYLDGGSTSPASGRVIFDDLKIGDPADIVLDLGELEQALGVAHKLYNNSIEGTDEGQFKIGSKSAFAQAIAAAQAFYDSVPQDKNEVVEVVLDLYDACTTFETNAIVNDIHIVDTQATKETKYLFRNMQILARTNLMFGMRDPNGYGVGWTNDDDRSDVKDVCGSYPAISAWGFRPIALDQDVSRDAYRMTTAFERGGINTAEWHQLDPQGRGFYASDVGYERIVATLLPGGAYHNFYKEKLWRIARYLKRLRGSKGQSIPVIFRPYHENHGDWFWWGAEHCTQQEFVELWQFTVSYLRDSLNVHSLLYAYSPNDFTNKSEYLERYPGDDYVDIIGHDQYSKGVITEAKKSDFVNEIRVVVELAEEKEKLPALTETGRETLDIYDWFTTVLLDPIKNDAIARNLSYAAVWRNSTETHFYAPYPGHPSVPDFLEFFDDPFTMFEDDLPDVYSLAALDTIAPAITSRPEPHFTAFDTIVTVELNTDERAYVRYSQVDQPYDDMPFEFLDGQGKTRHATTIIGEQAHEYTYYVRAMDNYGNKTDSSTVITFVIDTLLAPIRWADTKYDYSGWSSGIAPLGFGTAVGTEIASINAAYFRHEFIIDDVNNVAYLALIVKYDNGAIVWLNGHEIARFKMPYGTVGYETNALEPTNSISPLTLSAEQRGFLKSGTNVIAVEVHQNQSDANDLLFDLRLINPDPIIEFNSSWDYYDAGDEPEVQVIATALHASDSKQPAKFQLLQNYPNPFNNHTLIQFHLNKAVHLKLEIYDLLGRKVKILLNAERQAGSYTVQWDGRNDNLIHVGSGMFFYRLETGDVTQTKKMLLLK
ncbi:T9SS type A sorting domain-containing protein [candidate division KSB1 bacterium]|nr:T9SS type A sorting domain-containing protein [candidate division KSB1 bacterium]